MKAQFIVRCVDFVQYKVWDSSLWVGFGVNLILHCCFIIPKDMFNAELNIGFKT